MISKKSIRFYVVVVATILLTNYETMKAQVTIGADKLPETFSVLQLEGEYNTDKHGGLRMPRLTTAERNTLLTNSTDSVNAEGLAIYNTSKKCMEYWNGKEWRADNNCCPNKIKDAEGNTYTVGQFGDAGCWMTQNLRATKYADGTSIPHRNTAGGDYNALFYCRPDTALVTNDLHGLIYTWAAATKGERSDSIPSGEAGTIRSSVQGICPQGWVLPSDKDWSELEKELIEHASNYSVSVADGNWDSNWEAMISDLRGDQLGTIMKSTSAVSISTGGASKPASENGFNGLLVGRVIGGYVNCYGTQALFWSSSEGSDKQALFRRLYAESGNVSRGLPNKYDFLSVRCKRSF